MNCGKRVFWAQTTKLGAKLVVISSLSHLGQTGGAIICRCRWLTVRIRGTDINGITRQDTGGVAVERDTGAQLQVLAHIDTLCRIMQQTPHRLTDAIDDGTRRVHNKSSACANLCCEKDSDLSCKNDFNWRKFQPATERSHLTKSDFWRTQSMIGTISGDQNFTTIFVLRRVPA